MSGLGVTKPVSTKPPEPADFASTREMTAYLQEIGAFESPARKRERESALTGLTTVVEGWGARVSTAKGIKSTVRRQVRVMPFGSSRLGVATPGACVCV